MANNSKEILKNYVMDQNFTSPNKVLSRMKEMFKDLKIIKHVNYDKKMTSYAFWFINNRINVNIKSNF